jgi:hypothetical protein
VNEWEIRIEACAASALLEIRIMAQKRQEIIARRFAFIARSLGQQRRYARARKEQA